MMRYEKRMLTGVAILAFLTSTSGIEDLLRHGTQQLSKTQRDEIVTGRLNPRRLNNDFFHELLEDETHGRIIRTSMSLSTSPSDMVSPSTYPRGTSQYPTLSPSTKLGHVTSLSPTWFMDTTVLSKSPWRTNQPTLELSLSHIPVNTKIPPTATQPTIKSPSAILKPTQTNLYPSNFPSRQPPTTRSPKTEGPGEELITPTMTPIPGPIKISMRPSLSPTSGPPPSFLESNVFACAFNNIISIAEPPFSTATAIQFNVGYAVESYANQTDYIDSLERLILVTALAGAMQCESGGVFFTNLTTAPTGRSKEILGVHINTTRTDDTCDALISSCKVFETQFQVVINKNLEPDIAGFLGYVLLKDSMDDGTFVEAIPNIDRCEYLTPLPLLPTAKMNNDTANTSQEDSTSTERLSVSPWSLAAVSAMCAVGVIALAVWYKKRVYRNRRHMELVEDVSVGSPLHS